jgi:hypothetical protein
VLLTVNVHLKSLPKVLTTKPVAAHDLRTFEIKNLKANNKSSPEAKAPTSKHLIVSN